MQLTKEEAKYIYSKPKGHYIRLYQLGKNKGISNDVIKKYYHENIKQHIPKVPKSAPKPKGVSKATAPKGGSGLDALQQIIANLGRNVSEAIHPDSQTGSNINTLFTTFADAYGNRGKKGKGGAMTKAKILKICGEFCPDGPNPDTNKLDGMKTLVGHMVENGMMDEKDLKKHHNKVLRNLSKRKNGATMDDYTHLMAKKALVEPKGAGGVGGGINMPLFKSIMNILMPIDPLGIKKAVGLGIPGGGINMPLFKSIMQILMPVDPLGIKKAVGLGFGDAPPSYDYLYPGDSKIADPRYDAPPQFDMDEWGAPPTYRQSTTKFPKLLGAYEKAKSKASNAVYNIKNIPEVAKSKLVNTKPYRALRDVFHKVFGRGDLDKEMLKQLHHHSLKQSIAGSRGGAFKKAFFTETKKHINHPFINDLEMLSKHAGRNLALDYADHAMKTSNGGSFFNRKDKLNNAVQQSQNLANSANDFLSAATQLANRGKSKGPTHPNGAVAYGTPDMNTSGVLTRPNGAVALGTPNVTDGKISGFKKASNWIENKGNQFQKSVESSKPYHFVNNAFTKLFGRGLSDEEIHGIHQHALTSASKGPSYKHDFMEQVREVFDHPFIHELADASKNSNVNLMIHYAQIILETLAKMEQQPPGGNMFYLEPQFLADVEKLSNEDM